MDFVVLSKLLLRKKWYLILIPVLAILTTFLLTLDMQPEYHSTAKLATGFTTNERIVLANESFNVRDAEIKFNNLTQTMTSELMVSMMSYRLILNDLNSTPFRKPDTKVQVFLSESERKAAPKIFKEKLDSFTLLSNYDFTEKKLLKLLENYGYVNWMVERPLKVDWIKGSDYVEVQYISENPFLSAFIVNTLCEETIRYDNYLKSRRSDQSVTFFSNLVNDRKKALNEKTALLNTVMQGHSMSDFGEERPEKMNVIRNYESRRAELLSNIQRLNLSIEGLKRRMGATTPSGGGQTEINANISRIRKKIEDLSSQPEQSGAKGAATQKEIKELWAQLQTELGKLNVTNPAGNREDWMAEKEEHEIELKVAQTDLASVNSMLGTLKSGMSGAATKETTVTTLKLEVDKASEEYFETMNRFNTERSKALIASPLQLIISGQPNGSAEFPKRYLLLAFSALASFLLCLVVIVAIEYVDPRIKTREQFKRMVGLELAGTVNRIKTKNLNLNTLFSTRKSKELEQFKGALRKIRFEIEQTKGRVFLVTSTKQNEGKTFMILCISFMLAMLKNKILIIDTNFHHNSLTQILLKNFTNVKKLEQWTGTPAQAQIGNPEPRTDDYKSEFIGSIVRSETHHWIDVLGNNGCDSSPSEIFAGKDFEHIISSLKEYYDYIILEGASLNNFSDSMELVNYVDKVIPVFSAESDIESQDKESIEYLKTLDGKLMSAILNKTNIRDLNAY